MVSSIPTNINQGCQTVCIFAYNKFNFWYILDGFGMETFFSYLMTFRNFYDNIFFRFGMLDQEKSGNLGINLK
jgi:hypothetical protein